jgi:hypothetical protein
MEDSDLSQYGRPAEGKKEKRKLVENLFGRKKLKERKKSKKKPFLLWQHMHARTEKRYFL